MGKKNMSKNTENKMIISLISINGNNSSFDLLQVHHTCSKKFNNRNI